MFSFLIWRSWNFAWSLGIEPWNFGFSVPEKELNEK